MTIPDRMTIPFDTLALIPRQVNLIYEQAPDGSPVIGVLFEHKDLGHYVLWLAEPAAASLAAGISNMLGNRATFAAQYRQTRGGGDD